MEIAQRLLSTRRGSMLLGITAAVFAGILLLVYLNQYRNSVNSSNKAVTVLVAKSLIPKGTSGDVIGSDDLFQTTSIQKTQLLQGALTDASALRGRVVTSDVYPGQQLTVGNLVPNVRATVVPNLSGKWRAIAIPIDSAHGLIGQVESGDHIDVYIGFSEGSVDAGAPMIKTLMTNTLVLRASGSVGGGIGGGSHSANIVLRATAKQAALLAWAVDNGRLWFVLRPSVEATPTGTTVITAKTIAKLKAASGGGK